MANKRTNVRKDLPDSEWAFHHVPEAERAVCLQHEIARARGHQPVDCYINKPWLDLDPEERKSLGNNVYPSLDHSSPSIWVLEEPGKMLVPISEHQKTFRHYQKSVAGKSQPPVEEIPLKIDWRASKAKLIEDFTKFLNAQLSDVSTAAFEYKNFPGKERRGRRHCEVRRQLVDLALVRCDGAGLGRKATLGLLAPLLKAFNYKYETEKPYENYEGMFSDANWRTTVRKAKKSICPSPC